MLVARAVLAFKVKILKELLPACQLVHGVLEGPQPLQGPVVCAENETSSDQQVFELTQEHNDRQEFATEGTIIPLWFSESIACEADRVLYSVRVGSGEYGADGVPTGISV
nr:unnamed protein product [Spirometra erinaceieuropaei]